MANVFISYASEDKAVAGRLHEMLRRDGQEVFVDHAIAAGTDFSKQIEDALAKAQVVVVLLSRSSNRSRWVDAELRQILQSGKIVIPVLLDEEATNNWVWPLISDRLAIKIDSSNKIEEVVRQVNRVAGGSEQSRPKDGAAGWYPSWVLILVALTSAIATALVAWWLAS